MGENFHNQLKIKTLTKLFKRLCEQNQQRKFDEIWNKLDDLTKKTSEELAKKLVNPKPGKESVSLADMDYMVLVGGNRARRVDADTTAP
jgi:hypothetical protein